MRLTQTPSSPGIGTDADGNPAPAGLDLSRRTVEHYVITPRDPRAYDTVGLCGTRVRLDSPPAVGSARCSDCSAALLAVERAGEYATRWLITLPEAARALNLPSLVVRECEHRVTL